MDIFERLIGGLFLVIVMIWIGAYLYSRVSGIQMKGKKGLVRVVSSTILGPKKTITVVRIGDEYLVLGVTHNQISYLTKVEETDKFKKDHEGNNSV